MFYLKSSYVATNSLLPALKTYRNVLTRIMDILNDNTIENEMEVVETTLGRVEYEMSKLKYGVTIQITKRKRVTIVQRRRVRKLKSFNLFGGKLYTIGRAFQPISQIQAFQDQYKKTKKAKSQEGGVGIAYSIRTSWVAFILPEKNRPLPEGFVDRFSTNNRVPINYKKEGFIGWELKRDQKKPDKVSRFLKRIWDAYQQETLPNEVG